MHSYFSNGLSIRSEIEFPELLISDDSNIDLVIRRGNVSDSLPISELIAEGKTYQATREHFLLKIKDVAKFLIINNLEVIVDSEPGIEDSSIRIYILSTVFGIVLHKHNILGLHASCIKVKDSSILVCGVSGAGKSTTALGLLRRGYEILNDDISSVFLGEDTTPYTYPGYNHLKLWESSLAQYGYKTHNLRKLRPDVNKFSFPLNRENSLEPIPLKAIFFIILKDEDHIKHYEIDGLTAFYSVKNNTFRYEIIRELGQVQEHFTFCSALSNKVKLYRIERPRIILPEEFVDYIEQNLIKPLGI